MSEELKRYEAAAGIAFIGDDRIRQLQAEITALRAEIASLRQAGQWLMCHVTGRDFRANGIVLKDTSSFEEFLAALGAQ